MPGRRLVAGPRRVLRALEVGPSLTVLEIGPGTGFYSLEVARGVGPAGRLVCLDLQRVMLDHTRRRLEAAGLHAAFVRADACALPLRSEAVDRVLLVTVLGEIPQRALALAGINRALRPGGLLCVSEQFPDPDFVTIRTLRRELSQAGFVEKETRGALFYTSVWLKAS